MAQVTVGCKLPNGIILEMGDKRQLINGSNGALIIGGHGITENVDKDFFEAWLAAHADLPFVTGGFLFANDKASNTSAEAKDNATSATGFEGMDPNQKPAGLTETN